MSRFVVPKHVLDRASVWHELAQNLGPEDEHFVVNQGEDPLQTTKKWYDEVVRRAQETMRTPDKSPLEYIGAQGEHSIQNVGMSIMKAQMALAHDPNWQQTLATFLQQYPTHHNLSISLPKILHGNFDKIDDPGLVAHLEQRAKDIVDEPMRPIAETGGDMKQIAENPHLLQTTKLVASPQHIVAIHQLWHDISPFSRHKSVAKYVAEQIPEMAPKYNRQHKGKAGSHMEEESDPQALQEALGLRIHRPHLFSAPAWSHLPDKDLLNAVDKKGTDFIDKLTYVQPHMLKKISDAIQNPANDAAVSWMSERTLNHLAKLSPELTHSSVFLKHALKNTDYKGLLHHGLQSDVRLSQLSQHPEFKDNILKLASELSDDHKSHLDALSAIADNGLPQHGDLAEQLRSTLLARPGYVGRELYDSVANWDQIGIPKMVDYWRQNPEHTIPKAKEIREKYGEPVINQIVDEWRKQPYLDHPHAEYKLRGHGPQTPEDIERAWDHYAAKNMHGGDLYDVMNHIKADPALLESHLMGDKVNDDQKQSVLFTLNQKGEHTADLRSRIFASMKQPVPKLESLRHLRDLENKPKAEEIHQMLKDVPQYGDVSTYAGNILHAEGGREFARQKMIAGNPMWKKFAKENEKLVSALFTPEEAVEIMAKGRENPKLKWLGDRLAEVYDMAAYKSPIAHLQSVNVKFVEKLRAARDLLDARGGSAHYKELEKAGLNPKSLGIDHLRDNKQFIKAQDVQDVIDSAPSTAYRVGHSEWKSYLQNHNRKVTNYVFQLKLNDEIAQKLKDAGPEVEQAFHHMMETSFRSAHPVDKQTLGWARYSMIPGKGVHIDEIQSDLGQRTLKEMQQLSKMSDQEMREYADQTGQHIADPEMTRQLMSQQLPAMQKMVDVVWGGRHPSDVIHHAFLQSLRDAGAVGSDVQIWKPETKAHISGQKTGHRFGVEAQHVINAIQYPDTVNDLEKIKNGGSHSTAYRESVRALAERAKQKGIDSPDKFKQWWPTIANPESNLFDVNYDLPVHMREGYGDIPRKMGYQDGQYGEIKTVQGNATHKGKATWKQKLRKSLDEMPLKDLMILAKSVSEKEPK